MPNYRLYDQLIISDLPLVAPISTGTVFYQGDPIRIRHRSPPPPVAWVVEGDGLAHAFEEERLHIYYPQVGTFTLIGRDAIEVAPEGPPDVVSFYLTGAVLGILLRLRGYTVLHANAVAFSGGAVLFAGPSGAGKSTLTAACASHGYGVITDDLAVVDTTSEPARITGGPPGVRLHADVATEMLQRGASVLGEHRATNKVALACPKAVDAPGSILAVLLLDPAPADAPSIVPVGKTEAALGLVEHAHMAQSLGPMDLSRKHLQGVSQMVRHIPTFRIRRTSNLADVDTLVEQLRDTVTSHTSENNV